MEITKNLSITKAKNGEWVIVNNGTMSHIPIQNDDLGRAINTVYDRAVGKSINYKQTMFNQLETNGSITALVDFLNNAIQEETETMTDEEVIKRGIKNMIDFFSEFDFEPNFRFINSVANKSKTADKKEYILNYFRLLDNSYVKDIEHKMKSQEFANILSDLNTAQPTNRINNRLKVYYGSAGTGKTTLAQKESGGRCIVCNNSMFPSDIMEDFVFENGQPSFNPSMLWECMEKGEPIVLDEINLLPFDTLRFLQGLLDGKKSFDYKGRTVNINDGFEVIGTMNLNIGGVIFGLPEPLVDRCYDFKEFRLTADQLMSAVE